MLTKTLAAIGGAVVMALISTSPVLAQMPEVNTGPPVADDSNMRTAPARRGEASRLSREQARQSGQQRNRPAPAAQPTPEELVAAAQAIAEASSTPCQVTQANLLGQAAGAADTYYEAACATGPGYIFVSSTPPQAIDCVLLAGQAELDRARDPAADVGTQCTIPQNTDVLRVVTAYAVEAGVNCTVDQGASIGRSTAGNLIYEVGCTGVDGYWLEKAATGWTATECATIITQNATCRFSTASEAAATLKNRLTGSEAASCDITESRYMGANANGSFYEAKCGAGNGLIVRFNPAFAVQQVYPCESAHRIGGGCRLTVVPPEATPAA